MRRCRRTILLPATPGDRSGALPIVDTPKREGAQQIAASASLFDNAMARPRPPGQASPGLPGVDSGDSAGMAALAHNLVNIKKWDFLLSEQTTTEPRRVEHL